MCRALRFTKARHALVEEFRETDSDSLRGEMWQRALWKYMVKRDPEVQPADIERWVRTYKPKYNVRDF